MSYWGALRVLFGQQWRWDRKGYIVALGFALYMGATMSFSANGIFGGEDIPSELIGVIDWMFIAIMPIMGTCMSRTIFSIWRDDSYTRRIAVLRAYPIPVPVIIGARIAQSVVMVPFNVTAMLVVIYALSPDLRDEVSLLRWAAFGAIWICYSLIVNAAVVVLELGYSGKRYVLFYLIGIGTLTAIVIALTLWGVHPFLEVLGWTKQGGGAAALVLCAIGCAAAALWIGYKTTTRRLRERSIAF